MFVLKGSPIFPGDTELGIPQREHLILSHGVHSIIGVLWRHEVQAVVQTSRLSAGRAVLQPHRKAHSSPEKSLAQPSAGDKKISWSYHYPSKAFVYS